MVVVISSYNCLIYVFRQLFTLYKRFLIAGHNIKAVANASTDQQNYKSPAETSLTPTCTQQIGYKRHQNSMIAPLHSSKKCKFYETIICIRLIRKYEIFWYQYHHILFR